MKNGQTIEKMATKSRPFWPPKKGFFLIIFRFCARGPPGPHQGTSKAAFWPPFGSLWLPFGSPWLPFWLPLAPLWLPLAPFWLPLAPFSLPLGSLSLPSGVLWLTFAHPRDPFSHFRDTWVVLSVFFYIFNENLMQILSFCTSVTNRFPTG